MLYVVVFMVRPKDRPKRMKKKESKFLSGSPPSEKIIELQTPHQESDHSWELHWWPC